MRNRLLTLIGIPSALVVVASLAMHAQAPDAGRRKGPSPRTAWGDPDLRGTWEYATMTPLERPQEVAEQDVLTE